jgi:BirA family biotin operon repressor/biotin-[acetyl-CoA-carboxylase] ligase
VTHAPLDIDTLRRTLRGRRFGNPLYYSQRIESTNDRALELLARGFPEGTLVLAEEQVRGRGRRGRTWSSPARLGVYASLLLRPPLSASLLPLVSFAASLGIARVLEEELDGKTEIKWPNDLLVDGRKVAGLLAEARGGEEAPAVVVGMGLNVNQSREDFPEELRDGVTSLRLASGRIWDRTLLLTALLARWEEEHSRLVERGGEEIVSRWERYSLLRDGAGVRADLGGEVLHGRFRGLTPLGEMRLEMEGGNVRRVAFGEVCRVRGEA